MKKKQDIKQISIWYNRYGVDECIAEGNGAFTRSKLNELGERVSWLGGWTKEMFDELFVEEQGAGWVMHGYDGVGVFVVDAECDVGACKRKYDKRVMA
jgi:hypothetical protein